VYIGLKEPILATTMNNSTHPFKAKLPAAIGLLFITLIIVGVIVLSDAKKSSDASKPALSSTSKNSSTGTQTSQTYKDGTYSATGSYTSPGGLEKINVTLTLSGNIVSNSSVISGANDPTASSYQSLFISGYKGKVVGKKISEINLKNVSGSSLTPQGFMSALKTIENEAKA
jgi:hypothetical protein